MPREELRVQYSISVLYWFHVIKSHTLKWKGGSVTKLFNSNCFFSVYFLEGILLCHVMLVLFFSFSSTLQTCQITTGIFWGGCERHARFCIVFERNVIYKKKKKRSTFSPLIFWQPPDINGWWWVFFFSELGGCTLIHSMARIVNTWCKSALC